MVGGQQIHSSFSGLRCHEIAFRAHDYAFRQLCPDVDIPPLAEWLTYYGACDSSVHAQQTTMQSSWPPEHYFQNIFGHLGKTATQFLEAHTPNIPPYAELEYAPTM